MNPLPGQLELAAVIEHLPVRPTVYSAHEDSHKPAGIRLAKLLRRYDDAPSSDLWRDIQALAFEILK